MSISLTARTRTSLKQSISSMIRSIGVSAVLLLLLTAATGYGNEFKHRRPQSVPREKMETRITILEQDICQTYGAVEEMLHLKNLTRTHNHNVIVHRNNKEKQYDHFPSKQLVLEIIEEPVEYANEQEKLACDVLVKQLTAEELEMAARTTYSYWVATMIHEEKVADDIRRQVAMREARRHFLATNGNINNALTSIKNTLAWRKEKKIDLLRACFVEDLTQFSKFSESDKQQCQKFRSMLEDDLSKQAMAVRGYDKEGRSISIKLTRTAPSAETNEEAFLMTQICIAEKAIASTELRSRGKQEKSLAMCDFSASTPKNAVPKNMFIKSMKEMEAYYPQRSHKAFIMDAPFWMRALYKCIRPFLATDTQGRLEMISGEQAKIKALQSQIDLDQAMPFALPHGKLNSEIDIYRVVNQPFHLLYDEL